ncbi:MAG: helix-turn-helix domain-containing protein [Bacteroidetes bacterium]|nr:helix-turn-helix domain-containing protein [Bacteroidota bacterium]
MNFGSFLENRNIKSNYQESLIINMPTLGTKLLKLRREANLSQAEIADFLGVSQNAYNRWESDKCKPLAENF